MKKTIFFTLLFLSISASADYKADIGYSRLQTEQGSTVPDGSGVIVTQVEAPVGTTNTSPGAWMPDSGSSVFSGKTLTDQASPASDGISSHATGVGIEFYGNNSMASGINVIDIYSVNSWLLDGFLKGGTAASPLVSSSRIVNHSWVGEMNTPQNSAQILARADWTVEQNELIQVAAMTNGSTPKALMANGYNTIAVGVTSNQHAHGSIALDPVYTAGRTRPDVVVPVGTISSASPIVAAATAMLIDQAHSAAQGPSTTIANGDSIFNGERSEVIRAVLMAGADRRTANAGAAQITDYRADPANHAANGLDRRFGAGQLNVYNNHQIMDAGEFNSLQDGGNATVGLAGYDYDAEFGGAQSSNSSASYFLQTIDQDGLELKASLVWNIDIEDNPGPGFNPVAELWNLDLYLYDVTGGARSLLASSQSILDNTENLWVSLQAGRDYELFVEGAGGTFNRDYGLAWQVAPVPLPAPLWLFASGCGWLIALSCGHRARHDA